MTSKTCADCLNFDPDYHNGYCDENCCDTRPGDSCCEHFEEKKEEPPHNSCLLCRHFDPINNYCYLYHKPCIGDGSCFKHFEEK